MMLTLLLISPMMNFRFILSLNNYLNKKSYLIYIMHVQTVRSSILQHMYVYMLSMLSNSSFFFRSCSSTLGFVDLVSTA